MAGGRTLIGHRRSAESHRPKAGADSSEIIDAIVNIWALPARTSWPPPLRSGHRGWAKHLWWAIFDQIDKFNEAEHNQWADRKLHLVPHDAGAQPVRSFRDYIHKSLDSFRALRQRP